MNRRASLAFAIALFPLSCRSQVQLGDPDGGTGIGTPVTTVDASPRCPGVGSRASLSVIDPSLGELRAIAATSTKVFVLFARTTTTGTQGVLSSVPITGGALTDVAVVGADPVSLALSADGSLAFVASHASSQIFRVDGSGSVVVAAAGGVPAGLIADSNAGAIWALAGNDAIASWSFTSGAPAIIAGTPQPNGLARIGTTLVVRGNRTISVFDAGIDAAPRKIADRCDSGAVAVDNQTAYCVDAASVIGVDLTNGNTAVLAAAQSGASDVVVGAGRVFWRAAQSPQQSLVMTTPLDGIGGPTVVEGTIPSADPMLLAFAGCDLYFNAGREIIRKGL